MTDINNPKRVPKKIPEIQQTKASGLASLGKVLKVRDKVSDVLKISESPTDVPKKTGESDSKTHLVTVAIPENLRGVINENAAKTGVSPKVFAEHAIGSFLKGMSEKPNSPIGRYIYELGMNQLNQRILDEIAKSAPYTSGTEGDIYRMEIDGKDYIIVKKRFHSSQTEHIYQKKAYQVASSLSESEGNMVAVPEIFSHFMDGSDEYIVMEYVHGKTLYSLILEQLVSKMIVPILEKSGNNTMDSNSQKRLQELLNHYRTSEKQLSLDFDVVPAQSSFYSRFEDSSRVHFPNDTEAELGTVAFYEILFDAGLISENPNQKNGKTGTNPFLEKEFKKNISKLGLFQDSESKEIRKHLRAFLKTLHKNNLYHRDLGGNPRNIMFGENGKVYVIDFGKGVEATGVSSSAEEVYHDALHNGTYDDDLSILTYIDSLTESPESKELDNHRKTIEAFEKNLPIEQILKTSTSLGLSQKDIMNACRITSGMSLKGLVPLLDRLLVKNDRISPADFIYYPKILLGDNPSSRSKPEQIEATSRGGAKLLVSLFMLSKDDLKQLQKVLETKRKEKA